MFRVTKVAREMTRKVNPRNDAYFSLGILLRLLCVDNPHSHANIRNTR